VSRGFLKTILTEKKMRAEHRHELKTNELALWLSNLPVWAKQHYRIIVYVSVAVVLAAGSLLYYWHLKTTVTAREQVTMTLILAQLPQQESQVAQAASQGIDASYALLQTANELRNVSQTTGQDQVAAMSLIKEAEILRAELQFRQGTVTRQDLETQIARAKENYSKALDTYLAKTPNRSLEAVARLGLGLCEEELGNLEGAKKIYSELSTDAAFEGTTAAAAAKQRLKSMDVYATPITLRPAPKAEPVIAPSVVQPALEANIPVVAPQLEMLPEANVKVPNP
jgi:tetratricopeptide (TPR) repeat protein